MKDKLFKELDDNLKEAVGVVKRMSALPTDTKAPPHGFVIGNKWYSKCRICHKTIRVNKPILGDLHFCEEKK